MVLQRLLYFSKDQRAKLSLAPFANERWLNKLSQQSTLTVRIMGHYGTLLEHYETLLGHYGTLLEDYGPLEHNFELFWALVAKVVIFLEGC